MGLKEALAFFSWALLGQFSTVFQIFHGKSPGRTYLSIEPSYSFERSMVDSHHRFDSACGVFEG